LLEIAELSKLSAHYRLKQAVAFPRRSCHAPAGVEGARLRWPGERARERERMLRLADGTCVSKPGSNGTDWRVYGVFDLGSGRFSHLELTDKDGAEALDRGTPLTGEIRIGDRNYTRVPADFIGGWNAFQLTTPRAKPSI
jgi:hypothetical protein